MPRRRKLDKSPAAILKSYAAGASLVDLREKFGIRRKSQLAGAVLDAYIESGKLPALSRGGSGKALPVEYTVTVNRRGTIVIPKEAVGDAFRFGPGQSFVARRRGRKIILTLTG